MVNQNYTFTVNKMDSETQKNPSASKVPQYVAALCVTLGAVAAGTTLGYTSTTDTNLRNGTFNDIAVDDNALSWLGSMATLGAMAICIPIGYLCDLIGRKWACLSMVAVFSVGWLLIIFAHSLSMVYVGRFFTGLAGGAFCVAAPIYTSEIAEPSIRGALGSYFQVMLTVGILFAYIIGAYMSVLWLSILSALIPLLFGLLFFFQPETPVYLLKKGKQHEAKQSLQKLRGPHYNCDNELKEMQAQLDKDAANRAPFLQSMNSKAAKKAVTICMLLMFFQQMSGVNAIIFYTGQIFSNAGGSLDSKTATIIVGCVQVVATFLSTLVVDKFGRKILLLLSDLVMAISGCLLAIYFTLSQRDLVSQETVDKIGFLPILSLIIFATAFSLGFGPIPWMISAEMMPPQIKSLACAIAASFCWLLAFIITYTFTGLSNGVGKDGAFYIYTVISLIGTCFVYFFVPETKGKTLQEVQDILSGVSSSKSSHDKDGIDNVTFTVQ